MEEITLSPERVRDVLLAVAHDMHSYEDDHWSVALQEVADRLGIDGFDADGD